MVLAISRLFATDILVELTLSQYNRAPGFMGGPAYTGLFALIVLASAYLQFISSRISKLLFFILVISQFIAILVSFSKGAAFVVFSWSLLLIPLYSYRRLGLPYKFQFFVPLFSLIVLVISIYFVLTSVDIFFLREQGDFIAYLSTLLRTSSFFGRISYLSYNLFSDGTILNFLFGGLSAPSTLGAYRVFDSDLLYFSSTFGISGLFLYLSLSMLIFPFCALISVPPVFGILFIFSSIFNPVFSSLFPLPFCFTFFAFQHSIRNESFFHKLNWPLCSPLLTYS